MNCFTKFNGEKFEPIPYKCPRCRVYHVFGIDPEWSTHLKYVRSSQKRLF